MRKLILIKHAKPLVDPSKSAERWRLSDEGRQQALVLAEQIAAHQPAIIVSSDEPKAVETAQIIAQLLKVPQETRAGLHEHDRRNVPHMRSGEFISNLELFFRRPRDLVLGSETAEQAVDRFERAVKDALAGHPAGNVAIVSHGTVIALLVQEYSERNGFQVWRDMGLPSYVMFDVPEMTVAQVVNRV
jgi:broad specificity phosphatase PhoE